MLCALSQFLDNNVHVAESASTQDSQSCGLDSNRNSLTVEKAKNTFVSKCKVGEKNHGASCFKLSKLDFRTTQAYMVQSKSFPTNEQSNYLSVEANCDDEKNNFMVYEREHASGIHCFNWSEASNVSGGQRSKLADKFLSHIFQGGQGNVQRHNRRHLPVPKGPHTIGCVDLMCDLADHGTFFRLYYPTNPTNIQRAYKQWPLWLPRKEYAHGYMYFLKKNRTIFGRLAHWLGGDVYVPVLWQAPLLKCEETYPVIIVSHGIGGNRTTLSTYCYQLASRGFVVAAIEHRDGTASMTLCLREQLARNIINSEEADKSSNNNNIKIINNNFEDKRCQLLLGNGQAQPEEEEECELGAELGQQQGLLLSGLQQRLTLLYNFFKAKQLNRHNLDQDNMCAKDSFTKDLINTSLEVKYSGGKIIKYDGISDYVKSSSTTASVIINEKKEGLHVVCESTTENRSAETSKPLQPQLSTAFHSEACSKIENCSSDEGRVARWKQRRECRRRTLQHNHSCSEEWRPFQHVEVWDDFDYRNEQDGQYFSLFAVRHVSKDGQYFSLFAVRHDKTAMPKMKCKQVLFNTCFPYRKAKMYQRADEISDLLDELISMNEGSHINNALGLAFTTNQFKNRLDFSRLAIAGHSFGGAAALATLVMDERFKVGLCLDPWMHPLDDFVYNKAQQPVMFLNMESFQWEKNVNRMVRFQEARPKAHRPMMTLIGGCHQSVTDFQFIVPQMVGRLIDVCHTLRPAQCMSLILDTSLAFLKKHFDLPMESHDKDILECKDPNLLLGTNVDLTTPDDGPTPP